MTIKPIPTGTLAGFIAYHATLHARTDVHMVTADILDHPAQGERLVVLVDRGMDAADVLLLMVELHKHRCRVVWEPEQEKPDALWYMADHIKLFSTVRMYRGIPAHEIHLYWEPSYGRAYPVVAPLGAAQSSIFVYTTTEALDELTEWVQSSPTPMRIISGVM